MRAVNHTRPRSSSIGLWLLVWLSQIGFSPQNGEGAIGSLLCEGVAGSRIAVCRSGSSTGT
jgi:hypothetical protein